MTPRDISTQLEFGDAVRAAVLSAIAREARSMLWCDPDFVAWPLDDPALLDPLATWLRRPMRRLVLLGGRYDRMERAHPRFTKWRDPWVHAIDTREPSDLAPADVPTLFLDDGPTVLELWDRDIPRGRAGRDPAAAASARDRIDAALQRSVPAWPTKPLGL
jgi:hypothetical protein